MVTADFFFDTPQRAASLVTVGTGSPPAPGPPASALAFARQLHDTVVQRLAGLSLLLESERELGADGRSRCCHELDAALSELRLGLEQMVAGPPDSGPGLQDEFAALAQEHPDAQIDCSQACALFGDPTVRAFLAEGLRNARKHARPTRVLVTLDRGEQTLMITLRNDGAGIRGRGGCGMGLRLLETEASLAGGLVDSAPDEEEGWWRLRLILPAAPNMN
jgi:signal transduction histidine kinase